MRRKKGALDVSINSIVVIVFAVTMLGLGLAFIKGYFEKAQGTIDLDGVKQVTDATINNPISTSSDTFTLEKGKINRFKVKFYNNQEDGEVTFVIGKCVYATNAAVEGSTYFDITSGFSTVKVGEMKEFVIQLTTKPGIVATEYICNLNAKKMDSNTRILEEEQMTFKVK